jgi:hypothetical protein
VLHHEWLIKDVKILDSLPLKGALCFGSSRIPQVCWPQDEAHKMLTLNLIWLPAKSDIQGQ